MEYLKEYLKEQIIKTEKSIESIGICKITKSLEGKLEAYKIALTYLSVTENKEEFINKIGETIKDYNRVLNHAFASGSLEYIRFINSFTMNLTLILNNL